MRNQNSIQRNTLEAFHAASVDEAVRTLLPLCASLDWAGALVESRPYVDVAALADASDEVFAGLADAQLDQALSGHPRIGERAGGDGAAARLSRSEQSAMQSADEQVAAQLLRGNQDYEQRFNRVFLIRAAGRAPREILEELQRRIGNDDDTERAEVREQLRQITRLRLEGTFGR